MYNIYNARTYLLNINCYEDNKVNLSKGHIYGKCSCIPCYRSADLDGGASSRLTHKQHGLILPVRCRHCLDAYSEEWPRANITLDGQIKDVEFRRYEDTNDPYVLILCKVYALFPWFCGIIYVTLKQVTVKISSVRLAGLSW